MKRRTSTRSLSHVIMPKGGKWRPEVAEFVLSWRFSERDKRRIRTLNKKANEGMLTFDENEEMREYVLLGNLITLAQLKASHSNRSRSSAA